MLDSGAFTAWSMRESINLGDYIAYLKEYKDLIWRAIALDQLPGRMGQRRTQADVDQAAKQSYANLQTMKNAGLRPIPVFHRGESFKWLERMLKDGEDYIGLSPLVDSPEPVKRAWLDEIFEIITDAKGRPMIKTHGFGITNPKLMLRYPWHSVDSTAWVKTGGFGKIFVPAMVNGEMDFRAQPIRVQISDANVLGGDTWESMGPTKRAYVEKYFSAHGYDISEMIYSRVARCRMLLLYFNELEKHLPFVPPPVYRHAEGFLQFNGEIALSVKKPDRKLAKQLASEFYLFHSTQLSNDQASLLSSADITNRLLSYYEIRTFPREKIETYILNGVDPDYQRRHPPARWYSRNYTAFRRMKLLQKVKHEATETKAT